MSRKETAMADTGYNGWTNRATWNLVLWLTQDFEEDIRDWIKDTHMVKTAKDLREQIEATIHDSDLKCWYLDSPDGNIAHYLTPDAERFDDVDWDEVFEHLIAREREDQ
jgi:hypothetical protein